MLTLNLKHATGALYANPNANKPNQPTLEGFVEFALTEDESRDGPKLRIDTAAWTKATKATDDKPAQNYYSISIGGINGALFPEKNKRSEDSPDYTGTLGPNRELRVVGWKRKGQNSGETYVSILISEPQSQGNGQRERAPAREPSFI